MGFHEDNGLTLILTATIVLKFLLKFLNANQNQFKHPLVIMDVIAVLFLHYVPIIVHPL